MDVLHYGDESVSVAIEEIQPEDWAKKVYRPGILENPKHLHKKPGYHPIYPPRSQVAAYRARAR